MSENMNETYPYVLAGYSSPDDVFYVRLSPICIELLDFLKKNDLLSCDYESFDPEAYDWKTF